MKRIILIMSGAGIIGLLILISIPQFSTYRQRALYQPVGVAAPPSSGEQFLQESDGLLPVQRVKKEFNTESYDRIYENPFLKAEQNPLSTFSIDVDTASYSNLRRFLDMGNLPPKDAVRIEELINYFDYEYKRPEGEHPFSVNASTASCPWNKKHRLLRIGLKGKEIQEKERPPCNIVMLLDVSGSMESPNKLPLLKRAMQLLVKKLNPEDKLSIVVYAGASGLVLPSTNCSSENVKEIMASLERLNAGGSTAGSEGIQLAYKTAQENYVDGGINRVILATDGDFNVGVTNQGDLVRLIEEKAKSGVFLTVLGFGMGNLKDSTMEKLADKGNGNYGYIDNIMEARKILVEQFSGTLITIAKDVKIQVDFNPAEAAGYRLIGYENRLLNAEDFADDKKDAGEIGAGHTVTALYEIVPAGMEVDAADVEPSKYQKPSDRTIEAGSGELCTIRLRYKKPDGSKSILLKFPVTDNGGDIEQADRDFKFASAAAAFGLLLRDSDYKGEAGYEMVIKLASEGKGQDEYGYRAEFINMVRNAREMAGG